MDKELEFTEEDLDYILDMATFYLEGIKEEDPEFIKYRQIILKCEERLGIKD